MDGDEYQILYEVINGGSIFLTSEEFTSLSKKLLEQGKPPLISSRSLVTNWLWLEETSRVLPGVQVEKVCNVGQVGSSNWLDIMGKDVGHGPHFSAHNLGQVLEEGDILADEILLHSSLAKTDLFHVETMKSTWNLNSFTNSWTGGQERDPVESQKPYYAFHLDYTCDSTHHPKSSSHPRWVTNPAKQGYEE